MSQETGYTDSGDAQPAGPPLPDPLTPQERATWQRLCEDVRLAPAPWDVCGAYSRIPAHVEATDGTILCEAIHPVNMAFIAIAREALPRLLAALTACEADRDAYAADWADRLDLITPGPPDVAQIREVASGRQPIPSRLWLRRQLHQYADALEAQASGWAQFQQLQAERDGYLDEMRVLAHQRDAARAECDRLRQQVAPHYPVDWDYDQPTQAALPDPDAPQQSTFTEGSAI
jgi:hypothetical protein